MKIINLIQILASCALLALACNSYAQKGTVDLGWSTPSFYENGDALPIEQIGGYELVYKLISDPTYTTLIFTESTKTTHQLTLDPGEYEFMLAAFSVDGLYSDFTEPVLLDVTLDDNPPGMPALNVSQSSLARPLSEIFAECEQRPNCSVEMTLTVEGQ